MYDIDSFSLVEKYRCGSMITFSNSLRQYRIKNIVNEYGIGNYGILNKKLRPGRRMK